MVKACARAMGFKLVYPDDTSLPVCIETARGSDIYRPLEDDTQAMALVKRFDLCIGAANAAGERSAFTYNLCVLNADLNRAIVECVAKMQSA